MPCSIKHPDQGIYGQAVDVASFISGSDRWLCDAVAAWPPAPRPPALSGPARSFQVYPQHLHASRSLTSIPAPSALVPHSASPSPALQGTTQAHLQSSPLPQPQWPPDPALMQYVRAQLSQVGHCLKDWGCQCPAILILQPWQAVSVAGVGKMKRERVGTGFRLSSESGALTPQNCCHANIFISTVAGADRS